MKSFLYSISIYFLAVMLVACGGDADTPSPETTTIEEVVETSGSKIIIRPVGEEMKYAVDSITVSAGQEVTLVLENTATLPTMIHNIVVLATNSDEDANRVGIAAITAGEENDYLPEDEAILAATPMAQPGETVRVTFTAPSEPGEHLFICTYPGHYALMRGILVVV